MRSEQQLQSIAGMCSPTVRNTPDSQLMERVTEGDGGGRQKEGEKEMGGGWRARKTEGGEGSKKNLDLARKSGQEGAAVTYKSVAVMEGR